MVDSYLLEKRKIGWPIPTDVHLSELGKQFDVEDDSDHDDNISECNQYDRNEVDVFDKIIHVIGNLISHCHTFLFSQWIFLDGTDWDVIIGYSSSDHSIISGSEYFKCEGIKISRNVDKSFTPSMRQFHNHQFSSLLYMVWWISYNL